MASVTLQLYITDTLTEIDGVSIAVWDSGDTTVVESGVSDASGQLVKTLADGTYTIRAFKDSYTITETSFTVAIIDMTVLVYGDAVPYGAKTYSFYKDAIVNKLGGRNDATTLALIMSNFNDVQELLSKKQFEDLLSVTTFTFTASQNSYTFAEIGVTNLNEIIAIRINDGTQWLEPLNVISPILWDTYYATIYPIVEDIPTAFTRRAKNVVFYTTPDSTYTVNVVCSLYATPVTEDASAVDFSNLDGILVNLTTATTWLNLKERQLANDYFALADKLMLPYEQNEIKNRYASSRRLSAIRATLSK